MAEAKTRKTTAKKAASGKTLKVTQIGSPIGRQAYQSQTLKGLGLGKINRTRELQDSPEVRGMIRAVAHLITVEEAA
ncbi:MAG: 50S ribosomal protein L30 [Alphaproteobacteria bacterium]|nr:50S ribosomal protein L30 [Alphaproteobacteria bacterium]